MRRLKTFTIIGILFVLIVGSLAHFLYDWTGTNVIVGFFTPINESIWEHMKLLFFPMFFYSLFMICKFRRSYPCILFSLSLGNMIGTLSIPIFFYAYTFVLGRDIFILDISTFILSTVLAFVTSYKATLSSQHKLVNALSGGLLLVLFVYFMLFTYHAPDMNIFEDPTISSSR